MSEDDSVTDTAPRHTVDAFSVRMRASAGDDHVSGAETIVARDTAGEPSPSAAVSKEIASAAESMVQRALQHPRGDPDDVTVTVERLSSLPRRIDALPVVTLDVDGETRRVARELLSRAGVTDDALTRGFDTIRSDTAKRGAALVDAADGSRLDPTPTKGVRVTHIGTSSAGRDALDAALAAQDVASPETVREAVVLSTTVARAPGTRAELCWSDDPDYDTGYVATSDAYYRLPALKPDGVTDGGRAIFVDSDAPVDETIEHLENQPVLIDGASGAEKLSPATLFGDRRGPFWT
ncbi:6-carboxyhexanoate--CoA ligase [Haloplanus sp. C73]|uniref:6-carboxyhexanoate--CoA ligase n=1 Tax=Haloplanus sp. C73 TaxID=3421641 RepID=UPI003EBC6B99